MLELNTATGCRPGISASGCRIPDGCDGALRLGTLGPAERRRLAWHLPDDFDRRPARERDEILQWVRRVIVSGATDYRRYQAGAVRQRFGVRFPGITGLRSRATGEATARD
ncbi:hypothetical protein WB334_26545, partial [Escherichia coli]|uniref:hypothetical protein n=1 Tax=Escherichia coli TaxID=562 RepID=UPI0021570288